MQNEVISRGIPLELPFFCLSDKLASYHYGGKKRDKCND